MQKSTWKQVRRRLSEAVVMLAVPALAIVGLSPRAWSALTAGRPQVQSAAVASASPTQQNAAADVLRDWSDTQTSTNPITINLVQQARNESAALNNAVRSLRAQIVQTVGSMSALQSPEFSVQLLLQSLNLTATQRTVWDTTWRQIGRPGANQTAVQNRLINLQVAFVNANALLISFQANEIRSGSISTFTPPPF
jgi:hypothetical protein